MPRRVYATPVVWYDNLFDVFPVVWIIWTGRGMRRIEFGRGPHHEFYDNEKGTSQNL